jgi:hypothetical protein
MNSDIKCRLCDGPLAEAVDLGVSPLCGSYIAKNQLHSMGLFYPLSSASAATGFLCSFRNT